MTRSLPLPVRALFACVAAAAVLAARPAHAMSYREHCFVSNHALRLALEHALRPADGAGAARLGAADVELLRRLASSAWYECKEKGRKSALTYGDVVALVDYALSPIDFYAHLDGRDALEALDAGTIPEDQLTRLGGSSTQWAYATHNNLDHFQDRALIGWHFWHARAMEHAARKNLGTAIVLEAFANHYLQDHFAPGHVIAPRRGMHDLPSQAIHDRYNRRGLRYHPENVEQLFPFLPADRSELGGLPECRDTPLDECLRRAAEEGIEFHGDGRMFQNPLQHLYIALVGAHSVAQVLESYRTGVPVAVAPPKWDGYVTVDGARSLREGWESPRAPTAYGRFATMRGTGIPKMDLPFTLALGVTSVDTRGVGAYVAVETYVKGSFGRSWRDGAGWVPPSALSIGYDLFERPGRGVLHGPLTRYVIPIPRVDTQVSVVGGVRTRDFQRFQPHLGLGAEMGFALAHFGLAVSGNYDGGRIRPGVTSTVRISSTYRFAGRTLAGHEEVPPPAPPLPADAGVEGAGAPAPAGPPPPPSPDDRD